MSSLKFPQALSSLIKDYKKSFWNGDGSVDITTEDFLEFVLANPLGTVADLKQKWKTQKGTGCINAGVDVSVGTTNPLTLGAPSNKENGLSISLNAKAGIDAMVHLVLTQAGIAEIDDLDMKDLKAILTENTSLTGREILIILSFVGRANAELGTSPMFSPALKAGFTFKTGGDVQWFYCNPAPNEEKLYQALAKTIGTARLPQTSLKLVKESGLSFQMEPNEILYTAYTGFINLGANATFGFSLNGVKDYSLGALDLSTKLELQAEALLDMSYQLAGAFEIMVLPGLSPDWMRVVVKKNRKSDFNFSFGVTVNASLDTPDAPSGGLELVEAVLGTQLSQVLNKTLEYASMTPQDIRAKIDGFTKAIVVKYVDKAFDQIADNELVQTVTKTFKTVADTINSVDDKVIGVYEKFLDTVHFDEIIKKLRDILAIADLDTQKQKLLDKLNEVPFLKKVVEQLANEAFSNIFMKYEEFHQELSQKVDQLDQLVNGTIKDKIRKFVQAKLEVLKLDKLANTLSKYDSIDKLKNETNSAAVELVERLLGETVDKALESKPATEIIGAVNQFAKGLKDTITKIGDFVRKALNAKGKFQLSSAYQKAKEHDKLVDIQVRVAKNGKALQKGINVYNAAVKADFRSVFKEENLQLVKISDALFTDKETKTHTLNVNIFGWDYKEVSTMLANLQTSFKVGDTGGITVYKLTIEGKRITESKQRATQLNLMLQLAGSFQGQFMDNRQLRKKLVDPAAMMKGMTNQFSYDIKDKLTSLDELEEYFQLAVKLNLITPEKQQTLVSSVRQLKQEWQPAGQLGHVEVKYSFSYDGESLSKALVADYGPLVDPGGNLDNEAALEKIFVHRLLACCFVSERTNPKLKGLAALYSAGIFDDFKKNPNLPLERWVKTIPMKTGNRTINVRTNEVTVSFARVLYFTNVWFADFMEKYREKITGRKEIEFKVLETFLKKFVDNLKDLSSHASRLNILPFLVLDRMVQLTSQDTPKTRESLMEITIYDDNRDNTGEKVLTNFMIDGSGS